MPAPGQARRPPMPPRSKLTPKLQKAIVADVLKGHYSERVARSKGIAESTFYAWMARGEQAAKGDEIYISFFESVSSARASAEIRLGNKALKGDYQGNASMTWLERTRPKRYAQRVNVKVEEETALLLDVAAAVLPAEHLTALLGALADTDDDGVPRVLAAAPAKTPAAAAVH